MANIEHPEAGPPSGVPFRANYSRSDINSEQDCSPAAGGFAGGTGGRGGIRHGRLDHEGFSVLKLAISVGAMPVFFFLVRVLNPQKD